MPLESPTARDGDAGFIGFASRMNPVSLPAGVLQLSENMRLDRGTAKTRKGARRLADDILPSSFPLTLPFSFEPTLPVDLDFTLSINPGGLLLLSSYEGGIFTSYVYRSPGWDNEEVIVLAGAAEAYVYQDPFVTALTDQAGNPILDQDGNVIQSTNYAASIAYPSDETIDPTDKVGMVQAFDRLYLLREASPGVEAFRQKSLTAGGISVVGTTATVNVTAHGYLAGQRVRLEGSSVAAFNGQEYDIATAATANTFTVTVPSGTASDATLTGRTVRRVKAPLYWDGNPQGAFVKAPAGVPAEGPTYRKMRSVGWATYANGRLVLPDGRDSVMLSDVLNPNLYDPFWASFRANQGSNDYIVAVHPWVEGSFLVFMRNSIWLATVNQFASTDGSAFSVDTPISKLELLTDEIGCAARRTIQTAGQYVYFLSDSGVYRLDARLDLKLRGDTLPLSDPINDQIARIPKAQAENAVGLWHDNRYWLAAPVDGAENNNALFIYSALNQQWETIDYYGFGVDNLLVSRHTGDRRVYAASRVGKLFLLEDIERGDDPADSTVGGDYFDVVPGRMRTRRYGFGSMHTKRFLRVLSDVVLPDTGSLKVTALMVNPDRTIELVPGMTNDSGLSEDYTLKQPIRQKAHYCEIEFQTTADRPEIRTVSLEAAESSSPQTMTRHSE
jgi:hypothetical protein